MFSALVIGVSLTVAIGPVPSSAARDAAAAQGVSAAHDVRAAHGVSLASAGGAFGWPLDHFRVVRRFDPPAERWLPGHRGVDLAGTPSAVVHAAGPGKVVFAGQVAGRGVISVVHPGGLRTTYEPVTPSVAVGDVVVTGSELGRLSPGHPGCREAACLHWGLRRDALYLDPLALLGLGTVRLLPLNAGPSP
jgi:murein DD-endopeptidase MepM/ murein hydrolase activator NlpD